MTAAAPRFFNRELSWLAFNERVLEQATDSATPLFERLKFAAIVASNLDEFFMVRVASMKQAVDEGRTTVDPSGRSPARQLAEVSDRAHALTAALYTLTCAELIPSLAAHSVHVMAWAELDAGRRAALGAFFADELLPVLTPLAIDVARPFPLLTSLSLYVAVRLAPPADTEPRRSGRAGHSRDERLAIVQVPSGFTRLVSIRTGTGCAFILLEEVIRAHLQHLFPGQSILESAVLRIARDAELEVDDEGGRTHLEMVERELRRRRSSDVVRLEIEAKVSEDLLRKLQEPLDVTMDEIYRIDGPLDLRVLMGITEVAGFEELRDPPFRPVNALSAGQHADLFSVIDEGDVLLHHPYDAYDAVVALIAQAADDPDVLAIKQTLYRTNPGSAVIASLQRAAEQHKQVTVLVELTARFDEERNIRWARALEEAGAHVIYGIRGYKTHAKICLIVRRQPGGIRRYLHLGTGNYNEQTARVYTDFGLMTSSQPFVEDATAFFTALTGYSDPPRLKKLVMAPTELRGRLLKLIARERRRAEDGQPAEIIAKMNSLVDVEMIEALYAASGAGVRIRLNIRGICTLIPGVAGMSENIEVVSIVDRFLEHSRIFYFLNAGNEEVYLSSADWMTRNLDRRIELMFPVEGAEHRARVIHALRVMFADSVKARWLRDDGRYAPRPSFEGEPPLRAQEYLQQEASRTATVARGRAGVVLHPQHAPAQKA